MPLGDREETRVISDGNVPAHLDGLSVAEQRGVLEKLRDIVRSEAPPDSFVYERIQNIDILKSSEKGRVYSKIVTGIPQGNTHYHVIYALHIDEDHECDQASLTKYDVEARDTLGRITSLTELEDVRQYLVVHDSLSESDLSDLLERSSATSSGDGGSNRWISSGS